MLGRIRRRQFIAGAGATLLLPGALRAQEQTAAHASATLAELRAESSCCVVGRPVARESQWVVLGGARRIVTVHRVEVDEVLEGRAEGSALSVRTLGGRIGRIAQRVFGEAELVRDARAVFFLAQVAHGLYVVTDMAGGYYPLQERGGGLHLRATIPAAPGSAVEQLSGAPLSSMRGLFVAPPPAGALHAP